MPLIMTLLYMALCRLLFVADIPVSLKDSFFQGKACVTLKDKISQPSSALRHTSEIINILENEETATSLALFTRKTCFDMLQCAVTKS